MQSLKYTNTKAGSFLTDQETQLINKIVNDAHLAQVEIEQWSDNALDKLITDIAISFQNQLAYLSDFELDETKIGNVVDKKHKLGLVVNKVLKKLLGVKTKGKILEKSSSIFEYASPVGVLFSIIPLTNPISNSLFKVLLSIKTRNALIISYPRKAIRTGMITVDIIQKILEKHNAPKLLIQSVGQPSSRAHVKYYMTHPGVDLILATGGAALVKEAHSSGKPAFGVGPGNVSVFVSKYADTLQAAADIIKSKTYDNGIVCGSESNLVVNNHIKYDFINALEKNGAAVLNKEETVMIHKLLFDSTLQCLKNEYIGLSGQTLSKIANITRRYPIKLIVIPANLNLNPWLSKEKMAPILTMYFVNDNDGIKLAKQLLGDGIGHTAVIHSQNMHEIDQFAQEVPTGRLLVNTPAVHGMLGESTDLETSFMLGSGTYGGNITTDAITWRNLVNIKRLAFDVNKIFPVI